MYSTCDEVLSLSFSNTSEAFGEEIRSKINDTHTHMNQSYYGDVYRDVNDMGTTHIAVLAPNGQAVSVIRYVCTDVQYWGTCLMRTTSWYTLLVGTHSWLVHTPG